MGSQPHQGGEESLIRPTTCRLVRKEQLCKGKGYCNQPAERIRMALPGTQKEIPSPRPLLQSKTRKNSIVDPRPTK